MDPTLRTDAIEDLAGVGVLDGDLVTNDTGGVDVAIVDWAKEVAEGLVREDRRARLSDELFPDVVGEILLARLEHKDPVKRANAWLRSERSWRHHLAPLLEVG